MNKPGVTKTFQRKFERVLKAHPDLNFNGYGRWQDVSVPDTVVKPQLEDSRIRLVTGAHGVEQGYKWLKKNIGKVKRVNLKANNYYLKHLADNEIPGYISNGQIIAAAIVADYGFAVRGPCVIFAMSMRSINAVQDRINAERFDHNIVTVDVPDDVTFH
jgi:hypothetical protein